MNVHVRISEWLPALLARGHERAWDEFLNGYAPLILQVVHLFERDQDRIDDCFVFVCEQLKRGDLKRIRRFDTDGPASFSTWLRTVVRNLCMDWRRKRFGRPRLYRSIARLPALEREVFHCIHIRRLSETEAFHTVKALHPSLTRIQLAECLTHIETALSPRQSWLLTTSHPMLKSLSSSRRDSDLPGRESEVRDPERGPEEETARREILASLREALNHLPSQQRLLVRLRFEQELSFKQIAHLTRLGSPLKAQRALQKAVAAIREEMTPQTDPPMSVKDS